MKKLIALIMCSILCLSSLPLYSESSENAMLLPAVVLQDKADKWGFINLSGEFVVQPKYDNVNNFNSKGIAIVSNQSADTGSNVSYFINKEGKTVLGPFNCFIGDFKSGYAIVNEQGKASKLVDEGGKVVLTSKYKLNGVSEGMISFSEDQKPAIKYGYMDMKGNIVIAPKYTYAGDFENGAANVYLTYNKSVFIDKKGNILKDYAVKPSGNTNDYPMPFLDEKSKKYGYKSSSGKIVIGPKFKEAEQFAYGAAKVVVQTGKDEYQTKPAVINTKGEYIIKPEYISIHYIGQGLFTVNRKGYSDWEYQYYPNAIFNSSGKQLTDFSYYDVQRFNGDYASVCNGTQTFFIDKTGNKAAALPTIDGIGTLELIGDIIKSQCDEYLSYYRKDGSLIWMQNKDYTFDSGITVKNNKFRPDYYTYVEYPEVMGISDSGIEEKVNKKLYDMFLNDIVKAQDKEENKEELEYISTETKSYSAEKNKDLLTIEAYGYSYPLGAAHGMPYSEDYPINLKTGEIYKLKDLFKANSKYNEKLTSIVRNQIALNKKITDKEYFEHISSTATITDSIGFTITKDALRLTFAPYEIAAYAAGFVSFDVPYGQIIDIIDTKGAFWNSFDKEIKKSKVKHLDYLTDEASISIQNTIKSYESKIIEAINTNDFKKVEPVLVKDSSLYNDQKSLVKNLYKKGIKEKLINFEIYAIGYLNNMQEVKVYVLEDVGIMYPPKKSYETRKFSWCYTAKYDKNTKTYKLTKISKW
ncbi:MAG TPA: WG repeat-containing protein [Pseudobacteroides sp.]|uniref:WG repeat-containing protein n=1 Tax=Pseudobacteroides sp. TaxID=1968840 RepID=UPI002F92903E